MLALQGKGISVIYFFSKTLPGKFRDLFCAFKLGVLTWWEKSVLRTRTFEYKCRGIRHARM